MRSPYPRDVIITMHHLTKVLVVDDDPIVRSGLRLMFAALPDVRVVAATPDGSDVLRIIDDVAVDVVLIDVEPRSFRGLAAARLVAARAPSKRVVVMSTAVEGQIHSHMRNFGVFDFVRKSSPIQEFRRVIIGQQLPMPADEPVTPSAQLTQREWDIAVRVALGSTNDAIARDLNLSVNTVKTYISRALAKLKLENRVQLANHVNRDRAEMQLAVGL
jgi:DNA-binding NarL/FixJ family response regulator